MENICENTTMDSFKFVDQKNEINDHIKKKV